MRYSRQQIIPEFGAKAQKALSESSVLIIGAGGLGGPIAVYLAACGIATIGIVDSDIVELSNLHRQVWFTEDDIGNLKVKVLSDFIKRQNSNTIINTYPEMIEKSNAAKIVETYDLIIDGTDNFPTRYLINDVCVNLQKPLVFGAIYQFEGQVSVFNLKDEDAIGPNYRDIFPEPPAINTIPNCNEGGVIGVLPGMIGTMMAMEAIKIITGVGVPLNGYLLSIDSKSMEFLKVKIRKSFNIANIDYQSTNYNYVCKTINNEIMKSINITEFKQLKQNGTPYQLIDVRESGEYEEVNMGGELMPMSEIHKYINDIDDDNMVIVQCRSGARSASVIDYLTKEHGFDNLYNLEGGIMAWLADQ